MVPSFVPPDTSWWLANDLSVHLRLDPNKGRENLVAVIGCVAHRPAPYGQASLEGAERVSPIVTLTGHCRCKSPDQPASGRRRLAESTTFDKKRPPRTKGTTLVTSHLRPLGLGQGGPNTLKPISKIPRFVFPDLSIRASHRVSGTGMVLRKMVDSPDSNSLAPHGTNSGRAARRQSIGSPNGLAPDRSFLPACQMPKLSRTAFR